MPINISAITEALMMMVASSIPEPLARTQWGVVPHYGRVVFVEFQNKTVVKFEVNKPELVMHLERFAPDLWPKVDELLVEWEQAGAGGILIKHVKSLIYLSSYYI